jgi:hypothetical protein
MGSDVDSMRRLRSRDLVAGSGLDVIVHMNENSQECAVLPKLFCR